MRERDRELWRDRWDTVRYCLNVAGLSAISFTTMGMLAAIGVLLFLEHC